MLRYNDLRAVLASHVAPYPAIFATIVGSRVYGCASPDSDYDVHGVHLLPAREVLGLGEVRETIEKKVHPPECLVEAEIVTRDLKKFVMLLLKGNGSILEDLYSPLVVFAGHTHEALCDLGRGCITKHLATHYQKMADNQQRGLTKRPVKSLLHRYRCLLMGIHVMRSGEIVFDLPNLAHLYAQPQVLDLVAYKLADENVLSRQEGDSHQSPLLRLEQMLEQEAAASSLPAAPSDETQKALEQLVIYTRLETLMPLYESTS